MSQIRNVALLAMLALTCMPAAMAADTETIVLVRHGEKPALGLGQLTCQGLNRALALPAVIGSRYGQPDAVFAPNPAEQKMDSGKPYDYVRPLATIEPTAITFGLPINASIGVTRIDALQQALEAPAYRAAFVVVAWEHYFIVQLVRRLMTAHGGDPASVPDWKGSDYDSIYVVRIQHGTEGTAITFAHDQEGLNGQPETCQK